MVSISDLEKWKAATNGINESGQQDLTGEEWSALVVLNSSLQNGNFKSDESRRALVLLKDNLSRLSMNQILQTHLQNFIALCEQYANSINVPVNTPVTAVNPTEPLPPNTDSKPKEKSSKNLILIIVALIIGYMVFTHLNSPGGGVLDGYYKIAETTGMGTLPENIIISGNNFTMEYDLGNKIAQTIKFKYKDGNIIFTEGGTSISIPCELRNGSLWYSGVEYKKVK